MTTTGRRIGFARRAVVALLVATLGAAGLVAVTAPSASAACKAWTVIGVRGTDDGTRYSMGTRLPTALSAFRSKKGATNVTSTYVSYAATAAGWTDTPGKVGYWNSLEEGKTALRAKITSTLKACPSTRIALFGYSQGAHVVGDVVVGLSSTQRSRLQGVGLIGDPMFNPALSIGKTGDRTKGGMFGKRSAWPSGVFVYDVCNKKDKVCASENLPNSIIGIGDKNHQDYTSSTYSPISGTSGAWAIGAHVATRS